MFLNYYYACKCGSITHNKKKILFCNLCKCNFIKLFKTSPIYYKYYCNPCKIYWRSSSLNTYKNKCIKCKRLCKTSFSYFECIYDETKDVINSIRNGDVYENFKGYCDILKDKIIYALNKNQSQSNFNKKLR